MFWTFLSISPGIKWGPTDEAQQWIETPDLFGLTVLSFSTEKQHFSTDFKRFTDYFLVSDSSLCSLHFTVICCVSNKRYSTPSLTVFEQQQRGNRSDSTSAGSVHESGVFMTQKDCFIFSSSLKPLKTWLKIVHRISKWIIAQEKGKQKPSVKNLHQ